MTNFNKISCVILFTLIYFSSCNLRRPTIEDCTHSHICCNIGCPCCEAKLRPSKKVPIKVDRYHKIQNTSYKWINEAFPTDVDYEFWNNDIILFEGKVHSITEYEIENSKYVNEHLIKYTHSFPERISKTFYNTNGFPTHHIRYRSKDSVDFFIIEQQIGNSKYLAKINYSIRFDSIVNKNSSHWKTKYIEDLKRIEDFDSPHLVHQQLNQHRHFIEPNESEISFEMTDEFHPKKVLKLDGHKHSIWTYYGIHSRKLLDSIPGCKHRIHDVISYEYLNEKITKTDSFGNLTEYRIDEHGNWIERLETKRVNNQSIFYKKTRREIEYYE